MNQSSGSSEIEKIFPPEKYKIKMLLNCFVLGTGTIFSIPLGDKFSIKKDEFLTKSLTIGILKKYIWERENNILEDLTYDASKLNLWHVDVEEVDDVFTEDDIVQKLGGDKMEPHFPFSRYFSDQPLEGKIHIIIQPPTTTSSMYIVPDEFKIKNKVSEVFPYLHNYSLGQIVNALALIWNVEAVGSDSPSSQNDPCVKLKMNPSFFKINLPGVITEQPFTTVDLCLPSYESKSGEVYLNPFYDDPQFKETASLVREKLESYNRNIIVLAGVSGGGKTSTAFGISLHHWSIYIDFSPSGGQYGDFMVKELAKIRANPPKYDQFREQGEVFDMLDLAIVSRGLLLIKMLVQENISTRKEWLFAQLRMLDIEKINKNLRSVDDISSLIYYINECLKVESLILIFDEAQVLNSPEYGEYNENWTSGKKIHLLQAYVAHLFNLPVTCLIAGTYMRLVSAISRAPKIGKAPSSFAHIVLKLPYLSKDDVLRNLNEVIDMTDVTPKTCDYLGYILKGRPRNCASFVQKLISERKSENNRTKDQEMRKLLRSWFKEMSGSMSVYLENACKYLTANNLSPEKAIIDVLRFRVFNNHEFKHAIELLQHSIILCQSPECIILDNGSYDVYNIKINPSLESYLVSAIELFLLRKEKTLVDVFIEDIIPLDNTSSIGNEFDAAFITAMIQKRGFNVLEELNRWKNGQNFDLPSWITPTMKFVTISNLSKGVPIAEYVANAAHYHSYAIQPDRFSGSDVVISFADDEQNLVLLSASCTISGEPIKRDKIKKQLFKSCMKFQYMEKLRKMKRDEEEFSYKKPEVLQIGLGFFYYINRKLCNKSLQADEEDNLEKEEEEEEYDQDFNYDDLNYDLNYTKTAKDYQISKVPEYSKNHEKIKILTENRRCINVSVELPHRASKRSELFRFNEYGDLVIIVDDRNMEYVFGPVIKKLMERISNN